MTVIGASWTKGEVNHRVYPRRGLVVEVVGQVGNGAVPSVFGEASSSLAGVALGARIQYDERTAIGRSRRDSGSGEDLLQLSGTDDSIHFGDVLLDFVAIALDQAPGNDQLLRLAGDFVLGHFEDRVHRLLLGGVDKRAGIDDDDVGVFGASGDLGAALRKQTHHDLAVHQVLGTAQADEADFLGRNGCDSLVRREHEGHRIVI